MEGTWLSLVLRLRHGAHSLRPARGRSAFHHHRRPEIEAAKEAHAQDACGPSQRRPPQDSAGSLNRGSRRTPGAAGRDATSESANRKGAARHLVYALRRHLISERAIAPRKQPITTSPTRSEHSQGGAQRSEQYLYGAQRAIKWTGR